MRVTVSVEGLQDGHLGRRGGVADPAGLGGVAGRRIPDQHVLAGGDGGQVPEAVAVGQRVVDDLDLGVGDPAGVGAGMTRRSPVARAGPVMAARRSGRPRGRRCPAAPCLFPYPVRASTPRRCSALAHTSATGPSSAGSSVRMVSCSRTYQPS